MFNIDKCLPKWLEIDLHNLTTIHYLSLLNLRFNWIKKVRIYDRKLLYLISS